jgi:pentatricopeptide repeat protein
MEKVFQDLLHDSRVTVNGTHWASRINAYGCAKKDLDKAFAIFDEIGSTTPGLPDAICFEALLNVLVTNHRTDLFPEVTNRMANLGVRMTAYCANLMIKGYAVVNDMDKAREIFESMADPAFGVAAPDNHASHELTQDSAPLDSPIYREVCFFTCVVSRLLIDITAFYLGSDGPRRTRLK